MTTERENADLVRKLNDELNAGNVAVLEDLLAPGYGSGAATDHRERFERIHEAFPDRHREIQRLVADGDEVVVTYRVTGTHEGDLAGIEPTGEPVEMYTLEWFTVEDGRIVDWLYVHETAGGHWTDWFERHLGDARPPDRRAPDA